MRVVKQNGCLWKKEHGEWKKVPSSRLKVRIPERLTGGLIRSFTLMKYPGGPLKSTDLASAFEKIRLLPAENLIPHEKTRPDKKNVVNPDSEHPDLWSASLIDGSMLAANKAIIINGHHKHDDSLEKGLVSVPVFGHEPSGILIGTWYPLLGKSKISALGKLGAQECTCECASTALKERQAYFAAAIEGGKAYYVFPSASSNLKSIVAQQDELIHRLGGSIKYLPDAMMPLVLADGGSLLLRHPFTSQEVRQLALEGIFMPPKSTLHSFDMRAKLEIQLDFLKLPFGLANQAFEAMCDTITQYLTGLQIFQVEPPRTA